MLSLRFLGEIDLQRDGEPVSLPKSRKTVALLAYLAVTGRRHRRERLCALLWELPDDPRGALRWSLSKLRAAVDSPDRKRIVADRNSVSFDIEGAYVDVSAVRAAQTHGIDTLATPRLQQLADAFRGEFLEGFDLPNCPEFQAWCTAIRDEFREINIQVLKAVVARMSDDPAAVRPYQLALARYPDELHGSRQELHRDAQDPPREAGPEGPLRVPPEPSIAVLPFESASDDEDQEVFADGITEEIIAELSRFRLLFVSGRNSSFTYKGQRVDGRHVARQLGVRYVLEGSVRRAQDRIRITAQLMDATTGSHVWAEHYDRELGDMFAIQDEIAESVVAAMEPELVVAEMSRASRKHEATLDAWEAFMRAMWHLARFTGKDNEQARRWSLRAIELDPKGARPYAILAITHNMDFLYDWQGDRERSLRNARKAAERAVRLDNLSSLAARSLGLVNMYSRRHDEAALDFRRAIELCPAEAENHALLGTALGLAGNYDEALGHIEKAIRFSPRDPFRFTWFNHLAMAACLAERYDDTVKWARKAIQLNPLFPGGHRSLASALALMGRTREARAPLDRLRELLPGLTVSQARDNLPIKDSAHLERYLDGLRKAGLPE